MKIAYTENVTEEIENLVSKKLSEYEKENGVNLNYQKFAFLAKDDEKLIGALIGYTVFEEVYIDDLWVDKAYRGKRYGMDLMEKVEEKFKDKGFNNINLCTNEFQAPKFYPKCGYELEFVRKNEKNPKLNKYFFIKKF